MRTFINLQNTHDRPLPRQFQDDDVRFSSNLVRHFLAEYTQEGDVVFDPFSGFGTTLFTAQEMNRVPYGIELSVERYRFIKQHVTSEQIIHGDARRLALYNLPEIDFSITSPPYMNPYDKENPLTSYETYDGDYKTYLSELQIIYSELAKKLKKKARVVVEVSNLKHEFGVTPLAWHVAEHISKVLYFEGEVIACWDNYGYGYDHSYCLVFANL